jgi:hypothetical protein
MRTNDPTGVCEESARLRGVELGPMRCGDEVRHNATGETWVVAYADYESGYLSWFGWPEGCTAIADCTRTRACSDGEHQRAVAQWLDVPHRRDDGSDDHRVATIRRLYRS